MSLFDLLLGVAGLFIIVLKVIWLIADAAFGKMK